MPAPTGFKPAGKVLAAHFSNTPPFIRKQKRTGRRAQGVRYEKRVHEHFQATLTGASGVYIASPWLRFETETENGGEWRWCQPDALLIDITKGRILLLEVKYQHTSDAWWQLRKLYLPVLRVMFPPHLWEIVCCEVVKWFDPATFFPERFEMVPDVLETRNLAVHIWKI